MLPLPQYCLQLADLRDDWLAALVVVKRHCLKERMLAFEGEQLSHLSAKCSPSGGSLVGAAHAPDGR